ASGCVIKAHGPDEAVACEGVEFEAVEGAVELDFEHAARNSRAPRRANRAISKNLRQRAERSGEAVTVMVIDGASCLRLAHSNRSVSEVKCERLVSFALKTG